MEGKQFTWIPFYEELANKLLEYKGKRKELVEIVYSLDGKYVSYIHNDDGSNATDIDPFSVFAIFNRGVTDENRKTILSHFKNKLGITTDLPHDYDGVPILNAQQSIFFGRDTASSQIPDLWNLFESAINGNQPDFEKFFDSLQHAKGIKWNITIGLFWIRPNKYMPLDEKSRTYLSQKGIHIFPEKEITTNNYLKLLKDVKDGFNNNMFVEKTLAELSFSAWKLTQNENVKIWLVGYTFGGDKSQLDRFLQESIWEGGFDNIKDRKQIELVRKINKGDIMVLKSTSTKGTNHDIPFLRISALAIVDDINETAEIGRTKFSCAVKYYSTDTKDFTENQYGKFRKTIHACTDKEIIDYVMNKMNPQDDNQSNTLAMHNKLTNELISLLRSNHNLILTGAPGTGKTYLAKQIAQQLIFGEVKKEMTDEEKKQFNEQCGFVQFHPSYDYTDFVEGLRPVKSEDENGVFVRKDGCFKAFCKKAIVYQRTNVSDNFDEAWEKLVDYLNDNDFINIPFLSDKSKTFRTELNEYGTGLASRTYQDGNYQKGEWIKGQSKFFSKDQLYNVYKGLPGVPSGGHDNYRKAVVEKMKESFNLIDYKAGSISSGDKKPFVFIIDEINRGEISKIFGELFFSIDPGYRGIEGKVKTQYQNLIKEDDDFYEGFYVPENVYIIGTMNDIDRSVESMDFAFRRRFAFAEIKADENVGMLNDLKWKDEAIKRMNSLNNKIWHKEKKDEKEEDKCIEGLSSAYHIGASYFLKLKNYNGDFNQLWEYHLEGLLREYLRGMPDTEAKIKKLKKAYDSNNTTTNGSDSNNG